MVSTRTPSPFINLKHSGLQSTWLNDTGAAISCMSIKAFRTIPIHARPKKIGNGCVAKSVTGATLLTLLFSEFPVGVICHLVNLLCIMLHPPISQFFSFIKVFCLSEINIIIIIIIIIIILKSLKDNFR